MVSDLASPTAVSYFVLVRQGGMLFVRTAGKHCDTLLAVENPSSAASDLVSEFCRQLKSHSECYGQPIAVLVDNSLSYTYIKKSATLTPAQLKDQLQLLRHEKATLNFATKALKEGTLLVAQGIDTDFLSALTRSLDDCGLLVSFVATLPAYLALNSHLTSFDKPALHLIWWSEVDYSYLGLTPSGAIVSGSGKRAEGATHEATSKQIITALGLDNQFPIVHHAATGLKVKAARPLGLLLKRGHTVPQPQKAVYKAATFSRMARIAVAALNSLKLLLLVLLAAAVISAVLAGVTTTSSRASDPIVSQYQDLYAQQLILQEQQDSLKRVEASWSKQPQSTRNDAALIGLFCQSHCPGLALNGIAIRTLAKDSVVVEATGTAQSENGIFKYNQDLNTLSGAIPVTISSFRPEIVSAGGIPDTVLSFKLNMTLHETHARK